MTAIPATAEELVTRFLPTLFERARTTTGVGTYAGHFVVRVPNGGAWTLQVEDTALAVNPGVAPDSLGQVVVSEDTYSALAPVVVPALAGGALATGREPFTLTPSMAQELRALTGSILLRVVDGPAAHEILLVLGDGEVAPQDASCVVACQLTDFHTIARGEQHPLQLMLRGDIAVTGDTSLPTQIALALLAPES